MEKSKLDAQWENTFDWEAIHQRITATSAALESLGEADPEIVERIWAQRAAQLAKPLVAEEAGEHIELALVQLGCEIYAINVQHVLEIRPAKQITRVPRVPAWITGVINLSGRIYSVLNLQSFFGLASVDPDSAQEQITPYPDLVVVETPTMEVALLVEDVLTIDVFPTSRVQSATGTIQRIGSEYVQGVLDWGEDKPHMVVVLDLPTLLADERLIIQEKVS
jgi:purine-binding chemotaxis protein CheW